MWWNHVIFGLDAYHVILWFLTYSILGWAVESMYMSICNRELTNRGFTKGPFCPIYGIGALTVFFVLRPISNHGIMLFLLGSLLATTLEVVTAAVMIRLFGEIWWDYRDKPFNYRGVICLESSVAWGFYTIILFMFLHNIVVRLVSGIPVGVGRAGGSIVLVIFTVDFIHSLYAAKRDSIPEQVIEFKEMLIDKISR